MKRIIVVGGVAGGATAAARLRRLREDFEIIILERGDYVSFANCGLPYYIGHVIKDQSQLELVTPEEFFKRFNIDVRINHEVISINRKKKKINIRNHELNKDYDLNYDYIILSPGATPIIPPIKGMDEVPLFTLKTIPDSVEIMEFVEKNHVNHATIIGGGFIGLEMAENLKKRGIRVKIIEMLDQVMAPLDKEMAQFVHQELILNGVCLQLEDPIDSFKFENKSNYVIPKSGKNIKTDIIILSIGVKPDSNLAKDAGLELGPKGHIKVDNHMRTSDPFIYAVGDAIQVKNLVTHQFTSIALAGPANKQGRIAADNIAGRNSKYNGILGASVVKVFDLTVAKVGLTEKELKTTDIKYEKIYLHPNNHVGYYPGAIPINFKLIFEVPSGKILGAQAIGGSGTEKRIDVVSTVIKFEGTVFDLEELELTYAPPYGSAKDPINMAGYIASNILRGDHPIWHWENIDEIRKNNSLFLDVRTPEEFEIGSIDGAINISDLELRDRLDEIPKEKSIYVFCEMGYRGYLATRMLMQKGYNVKNLSGGYDLLKFTKATTDEIAAACGPSEDIIVEMIQDKKKESNDYIEVDACGLACPGPLNAMIHSFETLPEGKKLKIYASDPGFKASVEAYTKLNKAVDLLYLKKEQGRLVAALEKREMASEKELAPLILKKRTRSELRGPNAPSLTEITVDELYERINEKDAPALLIDVRTKQEYYGIHGHIKGARLLPLDELIRNIDDLKDFKNKELVMICHSGARSMMAAQLLAQAGFKDIRNLTGGMMMWNRKGFPMTRDKN